MLPALLLLPLLVAQDAPPVEETLAVGGSVEDVLLAAGGAPPSRRYALEADEPTTVTISLASYDFDARLRVESADGELVAEDDDSGLGTDARLTLALDAPRVVVVTSAAGEGEYVVRVEAGEPAALEDDALLDARLGWRHAAAERAAQLGDLERAGTHRLAAARILLDVPDSERADVELDAALELWGALDDPTAVLERAAQTLRVPATAHFRAERLALAVGYCRATYELARALGDDHVDRALISALGTCHHRLGDHAAARRIYEEGLRLGRARGDEVLVQRSLGGLASSYRGTDAERARALYEESLAVARRIGDPERVGYALGGLAGACADAGELEQAAGYYEQQLELMRATGRADATSWTLLELGKLELRMGAHDAARALYEESLEVARAAGSLIMEREATVYLARLELDLGDLRGARDHSMRALELARHVGATDAIGTALSALGIAHLRLGEHERARSCFEERLELARSTGDLTAQVTALGHLALVHGQRGELGAKRELLEMQLAGYRELGDLDGQASTLINLGGLHGDELGDPLAGKALVEAGLAIAREIGHREWERNAIGNLAWLCEELGEADEARAHSASFVELARETGDVLALALALGGRAQLLANQGQPRRAAALYEESLALAREGGERSTECELLGNLARLHLDALADPKRARELARTSSALARERNLAGPLLSSLGVEAHASLVLRDADGAAAALAEAERLVDLLCASGLGIDEAAGLRGGHAGLGLRAQDLAALRAEGADPVARAEALAQGFAAAGRWKGRALLEGIAEHRSGARTAEAIELRRARRAALRERDELLTRLSAAIRAGAPEDELARLRAEAQERRDAAEAHAARLREVSPADAELDTPLGAGPAEVRAAVLAPGELLVEYVDGTERLYAYVLGPRTFELLDLGAREEIAPALASFLRGISDPKALADVARVAREGRALYDALLAPALAAAQQPTERLIVVPTAGLAALPFEALVVNASQRPRSFDELEFVLDRHEVVYGPSTPVLVELAGVPARDRGVRALVLADPRYASEVADGSLVRPRGAPAGFERLPGTRAEALALARVLVGELPELEELARRRSGTFEHERLLLATGADATRARLGGDLRRYSVLHLACHGTVDAEDPGRTGLALAPTTEDGGRFTLGQTLELDLDAELVVLSACRTARGEVRAGEGVESLARAFLFAGARGVVASLWSVDDRAAASAMGSFYRAWLVEGRAPAEALRAARLELRRGDVESGPERGLGLGAGAPRAVAPSRGHPFLWAPFVHVGLPR